ncbi:hypothetical protein JCM3774_003755 [Rhodotorula dairenensis]
MAEPPRKRPRRSPSPPTPAPAPALPRPSLAPPPPLAPQTSAMHDQATAVATAVLSIDLRARYTSRSGPPTPFQQPVHLTSFSYSPQRQLLLDDPERDSALTYYREPKLGSDLNRGFEQHVYRDGTVDEGLDALLEALDAWASKDTTGNGGADTLLAKTKLITWRGMLTKLLLAVYESENVANGRRADGWDMNAMLVDDCLYLEESNPPAKLAAKTASERSGPGALPSYYGYAFEAYSTTPSPTPTIADSSADGNGDGDGFTVPNTNVQWCSVVKTSLGPFRTLVGGEVDCVRPGTDKHHLVATRDFVELKTNLVIQSQRDEVNFERHKLLKHYIQSFLLGVPTVTVGFRTRQGHLAGLQSFHTLEIPRLVRGKPHAWDPAACLASAESAIAFIRQTLASHLAQATAVATRTAEDKGADGNDNDDEDLRRAHPVFRVSFALTSTGHGHASSPMAITVRPLSEEEVESQVLAGKKGPRPRHDGGRGRVGFLPRWWVEAVQARRQRLDSLAAAAPAPAPVVGVGQAGYPIPKPAKDGSVSAPLNRPAVPRPPPPPPPPPPEETLSSDPASRPPSRPTGVAALLKR